MITYVKGNAITLAEKGNYVAFAHGCNCLCRMGRGIAKEVKDRLPAMWEADRVTGFGDRRKLGTFTTAQFPWGVGYNLYTQFSHSDKDDMVDWNKLPGLLKSLFEDMQRRGLSTLVIPKICSGLARGNLTEEEAWDRVEVLLHSHPKEIEVIVVEYKPDA